MQRRQLVATIAMLLLASSTLASQTTARAADTVYLDVLQHAAESVDRRAAQIALLSAQSALRLQTIRNERLPSVNGNATAQYFSDVASVSSVLGGALPGGLQVPAPYHDQYDASVTAREPLFDATRARRVAVENAQTAESAARIHAALWQQRELVNDAFFAIQLNDAQRRSLDAAVADLTARRMAAQERVSAGTALPSEVLLLDAELARRRQSRNELQLQRDATLSVLMTLVGTDIPAAALFTVRGEPSSGEISTVPLADDAQLAAAQGTPAHVAPALFAHARPEYETFDLTRKTIAARTAELSSRDLPRVSAFGRVGYGRPGLNPLGRSFDAYWNAGIQLEWSPLNWGRTNRELQSQQLQAQIVNSDEAAFSETVKRAAISQRGQISALEQSLTMDDSILSLRDRVLRETRIRFDEGEITSADFIARQTEYLSAQLDRDARRVRLSEARARYLTTIGREVR
ncbi:MAG: TolC family protein [Gemmatimonas sp.]